MQSRWQDMKSSEAVTVWNMTCVYSYKCMCWLPYMWVADHRPEQGHGSFLPQSPEQSGKGNVFFASRRFPLFSSLYEHSYTGPSKHQVLVYIYSFITLLSTTTLLAVVKKQTSEKRSPRPWIIRTWLSPHSHTLKDVLLHFILKHSSQSYNSEGNILAEIT